MQNATFVAHSNDKHGVQALQLLMTYGQTTRLLQEGEKAYESECVLFASDAFLGFDGQTFRIKEQKTNPDSFKKRGITVPEWAQTAAKQVAMNTRKIDAEGGDESLQDALENLCAVKRSKARKRGGRRFASHFFRLN